MKAILLGIGDYCKDVWHDWLVSRMKKIYGSKDLMFYNDYSETYSHIIGWKEGNLLHYIKQRKIAKGDKDEKNKKAKK